MCSAHSGEAVRFCLLIIERFYDELVFNEVFNCYSGDALRGHMIHSINQPLHQQGHRMLVFL